MPLALPPESSLLSEDLRLQRHYTQASDALRSGRAEHAREWCRVWVERCPQVPEFRILLREAQLRLQFPEGDFHRTGRRLLPVIPGWPWLSSFTSTLKWCERRLDRHALDLQANLRLADIAKQLGWIRTEIHALQTLLLNRNRQPAHVVRLGRLWLQQQQYSAATQVCDTFLSCFPQHPDLIALRDQVALNESMQMVRRDAGNNASEH